MSPALAGGFLTIRPPGKSSEHIFKGKDFVTLGITQTLLHIQKALSIVFGCLQTNRKKSPLWCLSSLTLTLLPLLHLQHFRQRNFCSSGVGVSHLPNTWVCSTWMFSKPYTSGFFKWRLPLWRIGSKAENSKLLIMSWSFRWPAPHPGVHQEFPHENKRHCCR